MSLLPLLLQRLAREKLPAAVYGYYAGGAETESTLRDNRAVYSRYRLMPRIMVNVSKVSLSMTLLGKHEFWVSRTQYCSSLGPRSWVWLPQQLPLTDLSGCCG